MEAVTEVLLERSREQAGLRKMVAVSLAAHLAAAAVALFVPDRWSSGRELEKPAMTIVLGGGSPGPRSGGMNPIGGRPIQTTAPAPDPKKPEPVRAPAPRKPEMTAPAHPSKSKPEPKKPEPKTGADNPWAGQPTRGEEVRPGSAAAETGAQGTGWGLSTGGVGGAGSYLDVSGSFCCPEYVSTMISLIERTWDARQNINGEVVVRFTILRDGRITDIDVEKPSPYYALNLAAQRALYNTKLPALPAAYTHDRLTVHLKFEYKR
ncbi:MAG: energy transducer TonB [Vicinamibacterales bacterium]